jgi:predicted membrane chloride channel (bestrophin family)
MIGLLEESEARIFQQTSTRSKLDKRAHRFPTSLRPQFVFHLLAKLSVSMMDEGLLTRVEHHMEIEAMLSRLQQTFLRMCQIHVTIMPFPYAQLTRLVSLAFLVVWPLSIVSTMGWHTIWCGAPIPFIVLLFHAHVAFAAHISGIVRGSSPI